MAALGFLPAYCEGLRQHYYEAWEFLYTLLEEFEFGCTRPQGAYCIITDIPRWQAALGARDDTDFSRKLIARTKVATVPGSSFYWDPRLGAEQVRFCFCKRPETLQAVRAAFGSSLR